MFLKNYTSEVPVTQTIARIEHALIKAGVSGIAKEYSPTGNGEIFAITFTLRVEPMPPITIRLPADKDAAQQALWLNYADGYELTADGKGVQHGTKKKRKGDFRQQAERTAWKLVQDWIEVQLSMIQLKQADFLQVFLPYVWDGRQTYYQALKANQFRAMLPEKCEEP